MKFSEKARDFLSKRPLGCCCTLFLVFTALLLFAPTIVKGTLLAISLLFSVSCLLYAKFIPQAKFNFLCLSALCFVLLASTMTCLLSYDAFDKKSARFAEEGQQAKITAYPTKAVYESDFSSCYILNLQKINGKRVWGVKVLCTFPSENTPKMFEILHLDGNFSLPENNDPSFDSISYYRSKGIFAQFRPENIEFTDKKALSLSRPLFTVTSAMKKQIDDHFSNESSALIKAILLGDKSDLSKELKRDFKTLGLSHLLAVSGLHLSVLFGLWSLILTKLQVPLKLRCVILIPLALFFSALCGFSPSVLRSSIMLILFLLSKVVDEESDSFTSLLFSASFMVFLSPYGVLDVGFLLSFFATLGILSTAGIRFKEQKKGRKYQRILKKLGNSVLVSMAAQIAVIPVICKTFGSFSLLSVPATLLFTPAVALFLYFSPLALLCSFIPGISILSSFVLDFLSFLITRIASLAVYFKEGIVSTNAPFAFILLLALILSLSLLLVFKKKTGMLFVVAACYLLFGAFCFFYPRFDKPQMLATTYEKNDIMIFCEGGKSLIVDLSDGSSSSLSYAAWLLSKQTGDLTPDVLLLTHYHKRHLNTVSEFMKEHYLEELYLSAPITDEEEAVFNSLLSLATKQHIDVTVLNGQDALSFGKYRIFGIYREYIPRSTHPIVAFSVDSGCHRFNYLSSSALEGTFYPSESALYLGVHGPIIKEPLDSYFENQFDLRFSNEDVAKAYQTSYIPISNSKCCPFFEE